MNPTGQQIMQVIIRSPGCLLEEIVLECPGLTWNQVFCELDRMSRTGQVRLTAKGLPPRAVRKGRSGKDEDANRHAEPGVQLLTQVPEEPKVCAYHLYGRWSLVLITAAALFPSRC
jgi:hypothetical protein